MMLRSYRNSLFMVFCAGLFWSTQGLAIRLIEGSDAWQILFYRSVSLTAFLSVVILFRYGRGSFDAIRRTGFPGAVGAIFLVFAYAFGILAMQQTTIADAVLLFATAPFFAAVLGWLFLAEKVQGSTWIAISLAMAGIVVMQGGAIANGNALGNLYAVGSALCFALFTLVLRWRKDGDMMPTVLLSGVFAAIICFVVSQVTGTGLAVPMDDIIVASLMGIFQTGAGLVLYTIGARTVPAVQLALLPLIEVILSPLWVALIIGEFPTVIVLVGGFLVGVAIIGDAILTARKPAAERERRIT
ncbi:DMT family transporter [Tateyamaria pelophila]|uniref:DMT family transporter n=1 Tax=Tateyamaria pelophila TaxID=328415 RepID=UPI001CBDB0E3|nr:DMT family transporter [Tateyamaria pelophila]